MKHFSFRMKTDSWLFALLLMAPVAPLAFTACEHHQPVINIELQSDYSGIVAAIRSANTSLADQLSAIETALSGGLFDSQEALSLIQKAVRTLSGTASEKLAAVEAAVKAQTASFETKLGLVEAAVVAGFADAKAQQELIRLALESLDGTAGEKLAAVEEAVKAQTTSLETKLGLIEASVMEGLVNAASAQAMIKDVLEALGGTMEAKLAAIDSALQSQTADLGAKLALIETALNEGFAEGKGQDELIQQALESLTGTVEEKLAALEEAVNSQTSSLETKLGLIEAAVSGGLADGKEQLALIQKAVAALSGDVSGQLSAIKAAIGSQTTSLATKLGLIEAAIQGDSGDSAKKLDLIRQAIESLDGDAAAKLEAIEQAISSQTSTLDTKLGLIEEAVRKGIASEVAAQALIQGAIESLDGNLEDKLAAIDTLIGNQTKALELKLQAIADAAEKGFADSEAAQKKIQEAIQSLGGTLEDKLAAIDTVLNNQTTTLAGKLGLIESEVRKGFLDSKTAQEKIQQILSTLSGTTAEKLAAIQAAITAQTTTLAGKLAAIQGALATGFANEAEALGLIKDAVASITTAVGTLDTNLTAKVKEIVDALDTISTNLSSDQIPKALADILTAIQDIKDYSDILDAIKTAVEALQLEVAHGSPKDLSVWCYPNATFDLDLSRGVEVSDIFCALDASKDGSYTAENIETVEFVPLNDTIAPIQVTFEKDKHFIRFHPDTTGSRVWRNFQDSSGYKKEDVSGHLILTDRWKTKDTIFNMVTPRGEKLFKISWFNASGYSWRKKVSLSMINDNKVTLVLNEFSRDLGFDYDKLESTWYSINSAYEKYGNYKRITGKFKPEETALEVEFADDYHEGDTFGLIGTIVVYITPSETEPSFKPCQMLFRFDLTVEITDN